MKSIIEIKDNVLDEELTIEELKEKMCGTLKPRRLTKEEIENLKEEGCI